MNKKAREQVAQILGEVRVRISKEMRVYPQKLVPAKTMAKRLGGVNVFSLYRWMDPEEGTGLPDYKSCTIMAPHIAQIMGDPSMEDKLFELCGHTKPAKSHGDIDPRLQWMIDHQDNPGVKHVLEQIEEQGEAILSHKPDKSDSVVRLVTFDSA